MWIPFAPFLSAWFPETGVFDPGIFDEINMPSPVLELALLLVIPASEIDGGDADIVPLVTKIPRLPLLFEVFPSIKHIANRIPRLALSVEMFPSISTSVMIALWERFPPEIRIPWLSLFLTVLPMTSMPSSTAFTELVPPLTRIPWLALSVEMFPSISTSVMIALWERFPPEIRIPCSLFLTVLPMTSMPSSTAFTELVPPLTRIPRSLPITALPEIVMSCTRFPVPLPPETFRPSPGGSGSPVVGTLSSLTVLLEIIP